MAELIETVAGDIEEALLFDALDDPLLYPDDYDDDPDDDSSTVYRHRNGYYVRREP